MKSIQNNKSTEFLRCSVEKLIVITCVKGNGTENDPYREVKKYYSIEGKQLFEIDSAALSN